MTGISYEAPGVSAFVKLRSLLSKPISKVAVIFHSERKLFVENQTKYAHLETVEIIPKIIDKKITEQELIRFVKSVSETVNVDAIWVPQDDLILSQTMLENVWGPLAHKSKTPMILSVNRTPKNNNLLSSFVMLPELDSMGLQAAHVLYEIHENNWSIPENMDIAQPLSIVNHVDIDAAKRFFSEDTP